MPGANFFYRFCEKFQGSRTPYFRFLFVVFVSFFGSVHSLVTKIYEYFLLVKLEAKQVDVFKADFMI